jgi:RES domain-containing protein
MRLWRISTNPDLLGEGGLFVSGRWHSRGRRVVYLADHPSSALLEVLVHLEVDPEDIPSSYQLLGIDLPDNISVEVVERGELPVDWAEQLLLTRDLGDHWLHEGRTALLRVPSAIVPLTSNWLLNPAHLAAGEARIAERINVQFDPRLFGLRLHPYAREP